MFELISLCLGSGDQSYETHLLFGLNLLEVFNIQSIIMKKLESNLLQLFSLSSRALVISLLLVRC